MPNSVAMREQRVGLIGYGLAGAVFHAPLISATAGLRLSAIVTANQEREARARERYPDARIYPDAGALFHAAPELDVVVIASPNRTHAPLALAAIEAGLAVVVDKPIAATSGDAQQVIESAAARGVLLTVFQNRRWDGDFLTVRRVLEEGALGDIARFESRYERWRPAVKPGWRMLGGAEEAGGLLFDLGSHLIDQALLLFGPVSQVYAELECRRSGVTVDDDGFVALHHVSGVRSHLWMSSVAAQPGPRFRVLGSRGAFVKFGLDGQEAALSAGADPRSAGWGDEPAARWGRIETGEDSRAVATEPGGYLQFYRGLVEALAGRGPAPVDAADAAAALRIIAAARESARSAQVIALGA